MKTIKLLQLAICMLACNNYVHSQNLTWAKSYGGINYEFFATMALDNNDHLYFVPYNDSIYKYNSQGAQLWAKAFNGVATILKLVIDNQQNIYATGKFSGNVDFDLGPGNYFLTTAPSLTEDAFVLKMDSSGSFIWAKQFQSTGNTGACVGISIDIDDIGNVYAGGSFTDTYDFDPSAGTAIINANDWDIFVCKLDMSGNFVWVKSFSSNANADEFKSLVVENSGAVIISGNHEGTMDYDPGSGNDIHTSSGNYDDAFMIKLDALGQYEWGVQYGCNLYDFNFAMKKDLNNDIIGCGVYSNTFLYNIPSPVASIVAAGYNDGYTFKIQSNGQLIWLKEFTGFDLDQITATACGPGNNIYAFGCFTGQVDLDPNAGTAYYQNPDGLDLFVSVLNQSGNFLGAVQLGYSDQSAYGLQIEVSNNGDMYLMGTYMDTLDADPGPADQLLISEGLTDIFLIKLSTITGIDELNSWQNDIAVFPNPASNIVQVQLPEKNSGDGKILLYNNLGQLKLDTEIVDGTNQHSIQIDKLPQGMYYMHIQSNSKTYVRKIIKS
jgi:hypothetical protein